MATNDNKTIFSAHNTDKTNKTSRGLSPEKSVHASHERHDDFNPVPQCAPGGFHSFKYSFH